MSTEEAKVHPVVEAMRRKDRVGPTLGIEVGEVRPGFARVSMAVSERMLNGRGFCHGGMIFTLADMAFAYASNAHGPQAVAASGSIEFLRPVELGDRLTAECTEQGQAGRSGFYDARLTNQRGELVALFRGRSATVKATPGES